MPLEGQHIGHYHLLRQLSESEGYEVYRAEDIHSPAQVILELVRLTDSGYLARKGKQKIHSGRIKQHLETLRASQLPRLVPIWEAEITRIGSHNYLYVITPYFKDGSLEDWWRVRCKTNSLTRQDADYIMQQATEAVQQLHSCGLAHQKLKLSSFLIQLSDNPNRPDAFLDGCLLAALRNEAFVEDEVLKAAALARDDAALQELEKLIGSSFRELISIGDILQQTDSISDEEWIRRERLEHEEKKARLSREQQELEEEDKLLHERREKRDEDSKLLAGTMLAAGGAGGAASVGSSAATVVSALANSWFFSRRKYCLPLVLLLCLLCLLVIRFFLRETDLFSQDNNSTGDDSPHLPRRTSGMTRLSRPTAVKASAKILWSAQNPVVHRVTCRESCLNVYQRLCAKASEGS
jgi:hypothetical protein